MSTLYELTGQYQYLYDLLTHGDIDEQTFSDSLEGMMLDEQLEVKAEGYAKVIRMLEADADAAKTEATRLSARSRAFESNAKRLKDNLFNAMKLTGREKFKTPLFSFGIQPNPGKVVIDEIVMLQNDIQLWKPRKWDESELDKIKIKELLQSGAGVPGAHLERSESLRIR